MSEKTQGARNIAEEAFGNERKFKQLVGALSGPSRRERQNAAAALSVFAKDHPDLMIPFGAAVIDALNRPVKPSADEFSDSLKTGKIDPYNALEEAAEKIEPNIKIIRETMRENGLKAAMTGSGSYVFGLGGDEELVRAKTALRNRGYESEIINIVNNGCETL